MGRERSVCCSLVPTKVGEYDLYEGGRLSLLVPTRLSKSRGPNDHF